MSDPMMGRGMGSPQGGMGGMPPQEGGAEQAMMSARSIYNPTDAQSMKQDGTITPDMLIKDFFATFGLDVNADPLSKLVEWQKSQIGNADPLKKMQTIAGSPTQAPTAAPASPPGPVGRPPEVQSQGGLAGLKTRLGG